MFEELFDEIRMRDGETPEFPIDLLSPGIEKKYAAWTKYRKNGQAITERHVTGDYIMVPFVFDENNPAKDDDYGSILFTGALDRNLLVYDHKCTENMITKYLVVFIDTVNKKNSQASHTKERFAITDIFYPEGSVFEDGLLEDSVNIKFHAVNRESWKNITDNYEIPPIRDKNAKDVLLAVSNNCRDSALKPVKNGRSGIALLDNRVVLLGAY